jgi:regulatory protein
MAPPLSLKARALQWLAQREHSRTELRRKLLRAVRQRGLRQSALAGTDPHVTPADQAASEDPAEHADPVPEIDALLDWLTAHRYLSEVRFVESRVHARASRYGQRRIAQELAQHGAELDDATAAQLAASEFDRARSVWLRKFGGAPAADAAARAKQMRFLAGRGFAPDVIRRVVRNDGRSEGRSAGDDDLAGD